MKIIVLILYLFVGCSSVSLNRYQQESRGEPLTCDEKAEVKSLQLLAQQYRCRIKK